jgi:CheY-like chemotaxis protein
MALALLLEEDAANRKLLRDVLELKFDVLEAQTAAHELELAQGRKPQLVVLDLELKQIDSLGFLRSLKSHPETESIPVVIISAHTSRTIIDACLSLGCREYLAKPIVEDPVCFAERMSLLAVPRLLGQDLAGCQMPHLL